MTTVTPWSVQDTFEKGKPPPTWLGRIEAVEAARRARAAEGGAHEGLGDQEALLLGRPEIWPDRGDRA